MTKAADQTTQATPAWRFSLVALLLAVLACLLIWRVMSLQILDRQFLKGQGDARTIRSQVIPAYRGVINDRNGEPLAVSTPVVSIWINPKTMVADPQDLSGLARLTDLSVARIEQKIDANARRGFIYLRRQLSPSAAAEIMALKLKGVHSQREYKRYYPAGEVASHLVGFTNIDDAGQEGLELAFEDWLKGSNGSKRVLKDLHGHVIRDIEQKEAPVSGKELTLSVDVRLQYLAYRELKAALGRMRAKAGSVVLLDAATGEVLAMVNYPAFNPNNRRQLNPASLRNRALIDMFEPGSTVKPFTVLAALESGKFQPGTKIDTNPGYIRVGRKMLQDPVNYGVIDVTKILTKSSQVGMSKVALALDEQEVWGLFQRFGLGRSTGSGFPGESAGMVPNRAKWRDIERVTFAYGYGLTVTPLQLAQAYSVIANGGVMQPVSLLRQDEKIAGERVITSEQAGQLVSMLKTVTQKGGTGTSARISSYSVAGKTGTVHKVVAGRYADDRYRAVFAGMAPASDPRLVAVVVVDEPDPDRRYHGGEAAAPIFSKVMGDALRLLEVPPDQILPEQLVSQKVAVPTLVKGGREST